MDVTFRLAPYFTEEQSQMLIWVMILPTKMMFKMCWMHTKEAFKHMLQPMQQLSNNLLISNKSSMVLKANAKLATEFSITVKMVPIILQTKTQSILSPSYN